MLRPAFFLPNLAFALLALCSCDRATPSGSSPTESEGKDARQAFLQNLHSAAEETALDGFQFNNPALGWPGDVSAQSASQYLALLASHRGLAPSPFDAQLAVANVTESDPLDTALFMLKSAEGPDLVIRKDGRFAQASPPPRDPQWLP